MAKIPLYRSESQPTLKTGKRSWGARMNSRPFVESIMANAETSITAANLFAEHFIARDRTAREAAAGKALLAAETAMQSKMTELTRVADPENVFGSDITKDSSWLGAVGDIKSRVRDQLDSGARKIFDLKIGPIQSKYSAALQTKIDSRINQQILDKYEDSAQDFVETYSDVNSDASPFLYDLALVDLENTGNRLVSQGRLTREDANTRIQEVRKETAENAVVLYLTGSKTPIDDAIGLAEGDKAAIRRIQMQPGGSLMLHALNNAPDDATRQDIVEAALDQSFEAYDARQKILGDVQSETDAKNEQAYNSIFSKPSDEAQVIFNKLDRLQYMSPQARAVAQAYIRGFGVFAEFDNDKVVKDLETLIANRQLTLKKLLDSSSELTLQSFQNYNIKRQQNRTAGVSAALKEATVTFRYTEEMGADIEAFEQGARSAYYNVQRQLMDWELQNPGASAAQIREEARNIITNERKNLATIVELELISLLRSVESRTSGLTLPRLQNGKYDYMGVRQAMLQFLESGPNRQVEGATQEMNYYLDIIGSLIVDGQE